LAQVHHQLTYSNRIDATDEESPLLHSDFTYPNFCCRVGFARNANKKTIK